MNNDPTSPDPSAALHEPSATTAAQRDDDGDGAGADRRERRVASAVDPDEEYKRRIAKEDHRLALVKKLHFMTQLMKHLDSLVFAEICTLYYMEYVVAPVRARLSSLSSLLKPTHVRPLA